MTDAKEELWILYDGKCPFCTRYVQLLRLRENLKVTLVDAREKTAYRDDASRRGYDLDRGMVVGYGGKTYFADEAITILSLLSTPSGLVNRAMAALFRSPARAKLFYPMLAFMRGVTVRALGRGRINNLGR